MNGEPGMRTGKTVFLKGLIAATGLVAWTEASGQRSAEKPDVPGVRSPEHLGDQPAVGTNAQRAADAKAILADVAKAHPAVIEAVHVGAEQITIRGHSARPAVLVGIQPEQASHEASLSAKLAEVRPGKQNQFHVVLPRVAADGRDRGLCRFRLFSHAGESLSAARWPTAYGPAVGRKIERLRTSHRKGLGGIPAIQSPEHEIFDLRIEHATLNVVLTGIIHQTTASGRRPYTHAGKTWFINEKLLEQYDETLKQLATHDVIVSAILLVGNHRDKQGRPRSLLTHPEAESRGTYAMPNLTAEEPARCYAAVLHLLAERWTREDGSCGRVSNWIMHNEVDQASTWTNMGEQPLARYVEAYLRSVRLMHHTARLFDPHARAFISLTHHWTKKPQRAGNYQVRGLLDRFAAFARSEGDFEWGVAYHPYPQNLRNPDTWDDDQAVDNFTTPLITLKNIGVLPRYLSQSSLMFKGEERAILLSEQGFNTPTLSEADQRRQVAAIRYAFQQIEGLSTIEAFHLHRYRDMPEGEGGLRFGLVTETGDRKLSWEAYRRLQEKAPAKNGAGGR